MLSWTDAQVNFEYIFFSQRIYHTFLILCLSISLRKMNTLYILSSGLIHQQEDQSIDISKGNIFNLVQTMNFWNNYHQICSKNYRLTHQSTGPISNLKKYIVLITLSPSHLATRNQCAVLLFQNDCNQRLSCLVTIQNERENSWLVDIIKNSGILHLFVAVHH